MFKMSPKGPEAAVAGGKMPGTRLETRRPYGFGPLAVVQPNPHCVPTSYGPKPVSQAHLHLVFNLPRGPFTQTTPCVDSKESKRTPHFQQE